MAGTKELVVGWGRGLVYRDCCLVCARVCVAGGSEKRGGELEKEQEQARYDEDDEEGGEEAKAKRRRKEPRTTECEAGKEGRWMITAAVTTASSSVASQSELPHVPATSQ